MNHNILDLDINKIGNLLQQLISLNKQIIEKFEEKKKNDELMTRKILNMEQIIKVLGICLNTAYTYIQQGILPKRQIGSKHYFYEQDIHDALEKKRALKKNNKEKKP